MAFLNIIVLFQSAMMDKMWDLMEEERTEQDDRKKRGKKFADKKKGFTFVEAQGKSGQLSRVKILKVSIDYPLV